MPWLRAAPPCQGLQGAEGREGIPQHCSAAPRCQGAAMPRKTERLHPPACRDSTMPTATTTPKGPRPWQQLAGPHGPAATTPHYSSQDLMMEQLPLINVYVQRIYTSACRRLMRDISMHKSRANTVINFVADSFLIT